MKTNKVHYQSEKTYARYSGEGKRRCHITEKEKLRAAKKV
jgi:hypothetical protein